MCHLLPQGQSVALLSIQASPVPRCPGNGRRLNSARGQALSIELLPVPWCLAWPMGLSWSALCTNLVCSSHRLASEAQRSFRGRVGQGQQLPRPLCARLNHVCPCFLLTFAASGLPSDSP